MTNYAGMAAPFAAAVVSASKGLTTLTNEYMAGSISSAEYFDLGMCLCAESTHFVRTALHHCALHLRGMPLTPQQFSPPNAPNGIYCADCDDYIKEIHLEDIGALNNYLLEKEIHLPEEDSRTEKFLDERSENIKFCDW